MEKNIENKMETGGIQRFKEFDLSYYIGEILFSHNCSHNFSHCGNFL